jgi:hypothetical protein
MSDECLMREAYRRSRKRLASHTRRHSAEAERYGRLNGRIKANPALRSVRIIAMTSYAVSGKDKKAGDRLRRIPSLSPRARVNC